MGRIIAITAALFLIAACAEDLRIPRSAGDQLVDTNNFRSALEQYEAALRKDPDNPELREGYYSAYEQAENYYVARARSLMSADRLPEAEAELSRGAILLRDSKIIRNALERVADAKRARSIYRDALVASRLGRNSRAEDLVEKSLGYDPEFQPAVRLLQTIYETKAGEQEIEPIRLQSGAPVTISFQNASFKEAALALGRAYGVNMIFDADLQDREISVYADRVLFSQAFELLLKSNRSFYRRLGNNTVIIAGDNPGKRAEYQDYLVRTFFIRSGKAQTIANTLSNTLGLQGISVDEEENTVTVRDTREKILLADRVVNVGDRYPAEVVMEVEVLEVNRTKSEQLGLDFGSQITVTPPNLQVSQFFPVSDTRDASALALPAATLRFFKQDVDAKTLASPRIRSVNGKNAVFHVGDEVPLRSSEIVETTGQTRTTFERRDVGIRLDVTPEVRLNSSVAMDLKLEISSLGQNLGTADEPAFVIGTRKVTTRMQLEDGETAIIGGLIRDEERDTIVSIPGLGRIPTIGNLFRNRDGQGTRTDIILTLTPRVVRPRDIPSLAETEFYSGTGSRVTTSNPNDFLQGPVDDQTPTIRLDISGTPTAARRAPSAPAPAADNTPSGDDSQPALSFDRDSYVSQSGSVFSVGLTAAGFQDDATGQAVIRFKPELAMVNGITSPINLPTRVDNDNGQIIIELTPSVAGLSVREIVRIEFQARQTGLSYLIFGNAVGASGARGLPANTSLRNARIVVR